MSTLRKPSDASQPCAICSSPLDGDAIACRICNKSFHAKKDCCGVTATICKAIFASENLSYLCIDCKSFNVRDLMERFTAMEAEIMNLKNQLATRVSLEVGSIVSEVLNEHCDRQERKNNLMLFGVDDSPISADGDGDEKNISILCEATGIQQKSISSFSRAGRKGPKPRPIRLSFHQFEDKIKCLKKSSTLKAAYGQRTVFLKHDLTRSQIAEEKGLIARLKARREDGENVIIRRGKIVRDFRST